MTARKQAASSEFMMINPRQMMLRPPQVRLLPGFAAAGRDAV